jgi:hypothetical protein
MFLRRRLKTALIALGLRRAPAPVRLYLAAYSWVGVLPAIAYVAWKYRDRIAPVVRRVIDRARAEPMAAQPGL